MSETDEALRDARANQSPFCEEIAPRNGRGAWSCCRTRGHAGDHVSATRDGRLLLRWARAVPPAAQPDPEIVAAASVADGWRDRAILWRTDRDRALAALADAESVIPDLLCRCCGDFVCSRCKALESVRSARSLSPPGTPATKAPGCTIVDADGTTTTTPRPCRTECPKYAIGRACYPAPGDPCHVAPPPGTPREDPTLAEWYEADGSVSMLPVEEVTRRRKLAAKVLGAALTAADTFDSLGQRTETWAITSKS